MAAPSTDGLRPIVPVTVFTTSPAFSSISPTISDAIPPTLPLAIFSGTLIHFGRLSSFSITLSMVFVKASDFALLA